MNVKIDLYGECGHDDEYSKLNRMKNTDNFGFKCSECGKCCKNRSDVVVSGYDLFRISKYMNVPGKVVINGFFNIRKGAQTGLPVLVAKQKKNGDCIFLNDKKCSIHSVKPLPCALYPLGQNIDENGEIEYFIQRTDCGGKEYNFTVNDYLEMFSIDKREENDILWANTCMLLSKKISALSPKLHPAQNRMLFSHTLELLYIKYNTSDMFENRFKNNVESIYKIIEKYKNYVY
jgi:Fe-S-cluster containining protein